MLGIQLRSEFCIHSDNLVPDGTSQSIPLGDEICSLYDTEAVSDKYVFFTGAILNLEDIRTEFHIEASYPETILAKLYEAVGDAIPRYLDGSFSVLIIDDKSLVMFRDSFCVENLYYYMGNDSGGAFIVSNSIKDIAKFIQLEVNTEVLPKYFAYHEIVDGRTFFKDILSTKSFELIKYDKKTGKWESSLYDDYAYRPYVPRHMKDDEVVDEIERIVRERILQIREACPEWQILNSFSGGVDSSFLQTILSDLGYNKAFNVSHSSYRNYEYYARSMSKHLKNDLSVVNVKASEIIKNLKEGIETCEAPVVFEGEFLLNAMYESVSKLMSQKDGGLVLLDGNGSEGIIGYGRVLMELRFLTSPGILPIFELFNRIILRVFSIENLSSNRFIMRSFSLLLLSFFSFLLSFPPTRNLIPSRFIMRLLSREDYERYKILAEELKSKKYDSRFLLALFNDLPLAEYLQNVFETTDLTSINEYEVQQMRKYNAPLIERVYRLQSFERELKRVNNARFQMAKARNILLLFPFVDRNLYHFMLEIPMGQKVKGFTSKYLLKKALSRYVPRDLVHRSKTDSASGVVWQEVFGAKEFQSIINEIKAAEYPYFDFDIDSVFNSPELWSIAVKLINFHLWHQAFIS